MFLLGCKFKDLLHLYTQHVLCIFLWGLLLFWAMIEAKERDGIHSDCFKFSVSAFPPYVFVPIYLNADK